MVLPCFNAERFLARALESILEQTHANLEIIAVDDGSVDETPRILRAYADRDNRVRLLQNNRNRGLIYTLNVAVRHAAGEFIARMDSDDLADPSRIERQLAVFARRHDIDVLGTGMRLVEDAGHGRTRPRPVRCCEPPGARFMALLGTPIAHTTLMARAEVMKNHQYGGTTESLHTEDYELFTRLLSADAGLGNLDEVLMTVRVDQRGVSRSFEDIQVRHFVACARRYLRETVGIEPEHAPHRVLVNRIDSSVTAKALREGLTLLDEVRAEFARREPASAAEINRVADMQRVDIIVQAMLKGDQGVRAAAVGLAARYSKRLLSPAGRRYLASKL